MVESHSHHQSSSSSSNIKGLLPLHKQQQHHNHNDMERSSSGSPPSFRRTTRRYNSGGSSSNTGTNNNNNNYNSNNNDDESVSLPTWSANPQSPGDDDYNTPLSHSSTTTSSTPMFSTTQQYNQHRRQYYSNYLSSFLSCKTVFLGVAFLATMVTVLQSRGTLIYSLEEVATLVHNNGLLRTKLKDADRGIKLLQREVSAYHVMRQQQQRSDNNNKKNGNNAKNNDNPPLVASEPSNQALEEMQELRDRLQDSQKMADALKIRVQKLSKTEAAAKYGDHVHRVEIELAFPDGRDGPTRFVIELAPLELMPHSVHFFLEMVSSQLLDGCSFILNALHVLKAAPLPYDGSSAASKARAFTRMGLESVAFKEYASSYPHEQYTVGFAADGSPSFYINTEDNSEIHLGDPCFGKIVEGFDTVKRLEASPTRNGIWFEQRIGIKKATVLM